MTRLFKILALLAFALAAPRQLSMIAASPMPR